MKLFAIKKYYEYNYNEIGSWFDEDGVCNSERWKKDLTIDISYSNIYSAREAMQTKVNKDDCSNSNSIEIVEIDSLILPIKMY